MHVKKREIITPVAESSLKGIRKQIQDGTKLAVVLLNKFLNERNPREKQMIIILGILGIIFLDYWLLIQPVIKTLTQTFSQTPSVEGECKDLKDDQKNKKFIEKNWSQAKSNLEDAEKRFIAANEMPAFLENISQLAKNSGVKVVSIQPLENQVKKEKKDPLNPYAGAPIKMTASAGTHEFGKFLASLETNPTFIRVKDIKISPNTSDDRKHGLDLVIEVYRKEAL